jgi:hypothetical protein
MAKDEILIRVLNTHSQKVKLLFPSIANNKALMRNMGFVISDPQYDAKMECIKMKKPFSENGIAKTPLKEAFAPKIEPVKTEPKKEQPKNEIPAPVIKNEPKKRTRRTKAEMLADKNKSKQPA